jgi:hypothetical protein
MESLFNFLSDESIHNSNVLANLGNTAPVIKNSKLTEDDIIKNYVKRLNNKVNDSRLEFKYSLESKIIPRPKPVASSASATINKNNIESIAENKSENKNSMAQPKAEAINEVLEYTFYLTLTIDGNKVLNILRGKIEKNRALPLTDIFWQYNLSEEFIDKIFNREKKEFYNIMSNYYYVVEKQMEMYVYILKKKFPLSDIFQIIYIYNFLINNNTNKKIIEDFIIFVKSLNYDNILTGENKKIFKYYYITVFIEIMNKSSSNDNFIIEYNDVYFYYYFYCLSNNFFIDNYIKTLTIEILKDTFFKGDLMKFINIDNIKIRIESEISRRVRVYINRQKMSTLENILSNNFFKNLNNKIIFETLIDSGARLGKISEDVNLLFIGNDFNTFFIKNNANKDQPIYLEKKDDDIFMESYLEHYIEIAEKDNRKKFGNFIGEININFTKNKVILTYRFDVEKDFLIINLYKQIPFNFYKEKTLKNKNLETILIMLLESSLKQERKTQGKDILFDTFSGKVTVNRIKKIETKYENSILIISFNEEHSAYDIVDCIPILYKVLTERPLVIILGSQESTSQLIPALMGNAVHYPHVLGECLKQIGYGINDDLKASAHKLKFFDKNVRLRTFFDTQIISYKNNAPNKKVKIVNFKKSIVKGDYITSYKNKKYIFFENSLSGSFFKGTIFFKIDINFKGKVRKFIFVNSHFFYTEKGNTGSMTRQKLLHKLISMPIKEFDNKSLIQLYSEDSYNVFFFGDLNFRLLIDEAQNKLEQIKQIKLKYLKYLNNNLRNESQKNELEKYLNNSINKFSEYKGQNITNIEEKMVEAGFLDESEKRFVFDGSNVENQMKQIIDFYQKFKQSFDVLGYDLLYKYKIKSDNSLSIYNSRKEFYNLKSNNLNHKMNIELFNEKKGTRVPSTTDRILFALNDDIKITRDDLDLYLYPDKSDHLMITLKVSLDNIKNIKNVLPVQQVSVPQVKQPKLDTVLVYEPPSSNSTSISIPFGKINNSTNNDPQFLVFNFDEKCEELLTDRFYVSKEKTTAKQLQQEIMYAFIQKIKKEKPAIVLVCTRNSPSRTDKHYQHSLKNEILQLNKDSGLGVNYFPLLKSDSTLQSNLTSVRMIGKKLCGIRSRLYVDQNQLNFTYNEKEISKSFSGKGNNMSNEYKYNNNIKTVGENLKTSITNPNKNIGRIIKYGRSRITGDDKKTGEITLNVVIKLKDGSIKQYLFCNYITNAEIKKEGYKTMKNKIPDIFCRGYFFTNKTTNKKNNELYNNNEYVKSLTKKTHNDNKYMISLTKNAKSLR